MRKAILLLVALVIIVFPLVALAVDYASMSDYELEAELNAIRAEITKREATQETRTILVDVDGITVTLKDGPVWNKSYDGTHYISYYVTVVNSSKDAIGIRTDDCYLNGWKIHSEFYTLLEPGMKTKETIGIYSVDTDADLEKLEDLEDVKLTFLIFDANTFKTEKDDIKVTLNY